MVSLTSLLLTEKKQRPLQPRGKINKLHDLIIAFTYRGNFKSKNVYFLFSL